MTRYRELMEATLKENARTVDDLKKVERIIFQADKFMKYWQDLGGRGNIGSTCMNVYGSDKESSQTSMRTFNLLMDEYFYSQKDFEIEARSQSAWIFITVVDKLNGAAYSVDLGMSALKGCVKEVKQVPVTEQFREEISYRCVEGGAS